MASSVSHKLFGVWPIRSIHLRGKEEKESHLWHRICSMLLMKGENSLVIYLLDHGLHAHWWHHFEFHLIYVTVLLLEPKLRENEKQSLVTTSSSLCHILPCTGQRGMHPDSVLPSCTTSQLYWRWQPDGS